MWISDVKIVLGADEIACGSVRVEAGRIAEIVEGSRGGIAAPGHTLMPGFIDMHGDMIETEMEPRVKVAFPVDLAIDHLDARLAATGVTTAYAAVSFSRGAHEGERRSFEHTSATIRALSAAKDRCRVDMRVHARFDITFENAVEVLRDLLEAGTVDLVSVMDHTPGQGQYRNLERLVELKAAAEGVSEAEVRRKIEARIAAAAPQELVLANLRAVREMCAAHGVVLASHDDDTAAKTNLMADMGAAISEFPVTLEAAEVATARGMMCAMGAPNAMRGRSYSGNLSAREAHGAGLLRILAADYHPAAILPAVRALAEADPEGLAGALRLATKNPAAALGLSDRGEIAAGKRADLVLVDALDRVALTLKAGEVIHANGTLEGLATAKRAVA